MASAREEKNPYVGGGGFGKFRKRPFWRTQTTPYDGPPAALRNPNRNNNGWFSKLVDPAQRLITYGAHRLFSSVFRKRLPPPPSSEMAQEVRDNHQEAANFEQAATNESTGKQQGVVGESDVQINSSDGGELTELEKLFKQKTFTRSEIDHLTELLSSRTVDSPVGEEGKRTEVVPSDSILPCELQEEYPKTAALETGIENRLVSTPYVTSSVSIEDVASPAELAKAYMGSRPSKVSPSLLGLQSPPREDSSLLKGHHFAQKSPNMSIVPRATTLARVHENDFVTPRSRGRSAIYSMARTPYARVYPASTLKGAGVGVEGEPSSSGYALGHDILSGSKQGALKRRGSVLDNDIGSFGPVRRIRQKSNLLSSKGLTLPHSGSPVSITRSGVGNDAARQPSSSMLKRRSSVLDNDIGSFGPVRRIRQKSNLLSSKGLTLPHSGSPLSITQSGVGNDAARQPSSSMLKPILSGEVKPGHTKLSAENVDDTRPSTSFHPVPSKSSEMASKILQQLDKLVSPKEKLSESRIPIANDKSPTKLSASMLRGQALRSMETVDSSKLLDNVRDNEFNGTLGNLSASAQKFISKTDKVENGPSKLVSTNDRLIPVITDADPTVPRNQAMSIVKSGDSSITKPVSYPPQKKRAFRMSAHEDYLELDDDAYPNGPGSPFSTSGKEITGSTAVAEKTASATVTAVQEMPPGSSVVMPSKSFTIDGKPHVRTADGSIVNEKADEPTSITSSVAGPAVTPNTAAVKAASHTILGSDKCTSPNGSVANPPLFNLGNKVVPSTGLTGADASLKESTKSGPVFGLEKAASSKEPGADAPVASFGISKNVDDVPLVPLTFSSSVGGESTGFKFGTSDPKLGSSISSTTIAGAVESMPKVLASDNADARANIVSSAQSSEPAVSSEAPASLLTSPANIFTFGSSSNQNNGPVVSSPTFSSPFPAMVTNNLKSHNIFSSSSPAASNGSISAPATSTSTSMTTSTPAVISSSNSSSSTQVTKSSSPTTFFKFGSTPLPSTGLPVSSGPEPEETKSRQDAGIGNLGSTSNGSSSTQVIASSCPTTSFFKFGSTPLPSTSLPVSSSDSEPVETKSRLDAGIGNLGSTSFGSSSAVGSTGSGNFGFSSSAMTTVNSQSQGSVFNSTSGSLHGTLAPSATNGFTTASSPLFGLTGNTTISSGSALFPSSSPATNVFKSGTTSGQSTPASSLEANPISSNNGTSSTLYGLSSWQPSKSPFGTSFSSSSSSTSGFCFGTSTPPVASTNSSMMFGSSTGASAPQFSFTSAAATTNMQPAFGSPSPGFTFGSASVNNDQMSMEDSMAEDTVQSAPPATPLFGQQPAPVQSNFVFGAPTPTGASPFQFGSQQHIASQNPSPFQASGSLEFNAGGSFSLGTGGGDKSGRKFVKVKHKQRKK